MAFKFEFKGYKALLIALVITLAAFPVLDGFAYIRTIIGILFVVVLLVAVRAVANLRWQILISSVLGLVGIIGYFGDLLGYGTWFEGTGMLGFALFFLTVGIIVLRNIMLHIRHVTAELIYGAINVYLLIGLSFTFMLALLELIQPGSITGVDSLSVADNSVMPFLYFSFVTMTTLGYGDMSPATGPAASLVYIEAIIGQLYVAIMIARLVGLYIVHESNQDQQ